MLRLFVCLLVPALAPAQHHHGPPPAEKPVVLLPGMGAWRHPIATGNPEAQKFFDQGLNLLYSFNRYEALRSFRKAAELDPAAAMPLWGVAMATGPHVNMDLDGDVDMKQSCEAAGQAKTKKAAPHEAPYVQAVAARCPEYQPEAYSRAMRAAARANPDDPDALTLLAESLMIPVRWRWYRADGAAAPGVEEAERALEMVLRRLPDHPGANHFYIHAVESSRTPERAVASAQRLMGIVPAAGHMVHMPAHIWLVLGDFELAASLNERAAAVDRDYMTQTGVTGSSYVGYYVHNMHFVAYARQMQGREADALRAADAMTEVLAPHVASMPELVDAFAAMPVFARLRFHRWDDILKMPRPDPRLKANSMMWRFARATAMAARGDRDGAGRERAEFETLRAKLPPAAIWGNNKMADVMALASVILEARTAPSPAAAVPHWERAVELQDALVYEEPPAWYHPVRESLGAALLRAGRAPEAETVFREGVRRSPRNGRMLHGLLQSLRAQKKTEAAEWVEKEFRAAWSRADSKPLVEGI